MRKNEFTGSHYRADVIGSKRGPDGREYELYRDYYGNFFIGVTPSTEYNSAQSIKAAYASKIIKKESWTYDIGARVNTGVTTEIDERIVDTNVDKLYEIFERSKDRVIAIYKLASEERMFYCHILEDGKEEFDFFLEHDYEHMYQCLLCWSCADNNALYQILKSRIHGPICASRLT